MKLEETKEPQVRFQFNGKRARELLRNENDYISKLFSVIPLNTSEKDEENDSDAEVYVRKKPKALPTTGTKRAKTFDELQAKLEELKRHKRLDYKQKLLKKGLQNRMKKKAKKEERIQRMKLARSEQKSSATVGKVKKEEGEEEDTENNKERKAKPTFNSEGKIVFSKFDFSDIGKKKKSNKGEKDPKKILQQLKERKQKLKELEAAGEKDKASELKEKDAWRSVLAKASGEKVKDDPELLKRTIKRDEKKKEHSAKKWAARKESVQKGIQERQQKRQENIMARKKDKKTHKLKRAAKKGRIIPGY